MHHEVRHLRLEQPRDRHRRSSGRDRRHDARQAHARHGGVARRPLDAQRADEAVALCRNHDVERVDIPRRQRDRALLQDGDFRLLHHDRRRGGEPARRGDLYRPLARRQRDDDAVRVDARDVLSQ